MITFFSLEYLYKSTRSKQEAKKDEPTTATYRRTTKYRDFGCSASCNWIWNRWPFTSQSFRAPSGHFKVLSGKTPYASLFDYKDIFEVLNFCQGISYWFSNSCLPLRTMIIEVQSFYSAVTLYFICVLIPQTLMSNTWPTCSCMHYMLYLDLCFMVYGIDMCARVKLYNFYWITFRYFQLLE